MSVLRKGLLESKLAIVTGGGTGIGRAITRELLYLGANVIIASRKLDVLTSAAKELTSELDLKSNRCEVFKCNIREESEVKQLFEFALEKFGKVDFLVNNGGGQFPSTAESISANGWRSVIDLNLTGTFLCCKEAFNGGKMGENGGAIVNIVCEMNSGFPGMSHTGAARAGVVNLTKTLAVEWAPQRIRVNAVAPGVIFNDSAKTHYGKTAIPEMLELGVNATPSRRLGTPEEVSSAVVFLLSPGASYITGINLDVGGGSHLSPLPLTYLIKKDQYMPWPKPPKL